MKTFFKNIATSKLFKVASLNSFSILIKLITGIFTSKALAVFVGPEGLALFGNFRNFITATQSVSTLGVSAGVVKYVSEFKFKVFRLSKTISTVASLILVSTVIVSVFCYVFANTLSEFIFGGDTDYALLIKLFSMTLPFYAFSSIAISVINGFSHYKTVLKITIIAQILVTVYTLVLIWKQELEGALTALATSQAILFFIVLFWVVRGKQFFKLIKFRKINYKNLKLLSSFSIMALSTALLIPFVQIEIRNYIMDTISAESAGFWEAILRVSNYYLLFISTLLALYILPRFSELNTDMAFRNEVFNFYKTILPFFIIGLIIIYVLRFLIVRLLFSEDFMPMTELFLWQELGDVFKVLSLVISYQFLAKRMFWHYMITEVVSLTILYATSIYCIDIFGVKGATIGHCITFAVYFGIILMIFRRPLFFPLKTHDL
ncbi:MAG: O-antigen translocase [Bacteroidota bacterium]